MAAAVPRRFRAGFRVLSLFWGTAWCAAGAGAQTKPEPSPPTQAKPAKKPAGVGRSSVLSERAQADRDAGMELFQARDYAGAVARFESAYRYSSDVRLLLLTARAESELGHHVKAERLVEHFLADDLAGLTPAERAEGEALLASLEPFLGTLRFDVRPKGATVSVDSVVVGVSPLLDPVRVEAGERRIQFEHEGYESQATLRTIASGADVEVTVTLQPVARQSTLRVSAEKGAAIYVNDKLVGIGEWSGSLPSGVHVIAVTNPGKRPYQRELSLEPDASQSLEVTLDPLTAGPSGDARDTSSKAWLWVSLGVVLIAGLSVGAYFAFKPDETTPVNGTLDTVPLPVTAIGF